MTHQRRSTREPCAQPGYSICIAIYYLSTCTEWRFV